MHKRYLTLLFLVCPLVGQAKDLGSWGDVWPVQEQSFLALIQDRLQGLQDNGQMAELQQQFQDRVVEHTLRPTPVEGLVTDTQAHTSGMTRPLWLARRWPMRRVRSLRVRAIP